MDRYWSLQEASEYLGVSVRTLYAMVKAEKIPACRVGRLWKFTKADIDAFVKGVTLSVIDEVVNTKKGVGE